ncbi:DUF3574 domain-containing protein [Komagataeibacter diospyri]|uniref:DUF3574 domain-containing protein n=1 Tax=Komagataeibacter diospyri TaxID=1932662 RepID=A0A4P5NUR0_9PROT|nr:DUF3574 domain-containing protein [Komagataeibacter diospyri]GCE82273.1 hypothetical protein MSKU9_0414 [Komagataeibacter diospyri]GCE88624.1 hypothetical protein MSKU15_0225 [Komagataeibacter diospyri]
MTAYRRILPVLLILLETIGWDHPGRAHGLPAPPVITDATGSTCAALHAQPDVRISLLFGLNRPHGGRVTKREWNTFLRDTVTPRFPTGLSVLRVEGQWQDRESGQIGREPGRIVWIVTSPAPDLADRLDAIRQIYRTRFQQQAVGVVITAGCDTF